MARAKNTALIIKPVAMTPRRTHSTGTRLDHRAPQKPPAVAATIMAKPCGQAMAPATTNATTDKTDSTNELRFFRALTVWIRPSPVRFKAPSAKCPSPR